MDKLSELNKSIDELESQRNSVLSELRSQCKHLRLVELDSNPPMRICEDCGAEKRGWYCGYHVLVMNGDSHIDPYKSERVLTLRTTDSQKFYSFRKRGPRYLVGQSHPNFGGGFQTYEQLTSQ